MKKIFFVLLISLSILLSASSPTLQSKDGWFIRICLTETTAERAWFEAGAGDDASSKTRKFNWKQGRDNVIEVHSDYRYKTDLNFTVDTKGKGIAVVCVLYDNRVVKTLEVHTKESHTINNNETDNCPC